MVSLLALSLALAAPASATQAATDGVDPVRLAANVVAQMQLETPMLTGTDAPPQIDEMTIRPDASVCYKIRAFIFSKGQNPKLLRETTCGPKAATERQTDGLKLVPLEQRVDPEIAPRK